MTSRMDAHLELSPRLAGGTSATRPSARRPACCCQESSFLPPGVNESADPGQA